MTQLVDSMFIVTSRAGLEAYFGKGHIFGAISGRL